VSISLVAAARARNLQTAIYEVPPDTPNLGYFDVFEVPQYAIYTDIVTYPIDIVSGRCIFQHIIYQKL